MTVLIGSHERFLDHDPGLHHPERAARLQAVATGLGRAGLGEELIGFEPREATPAELAAVHEVAYLNFLERHCESGGGPLDADTAAGSGSLEAARRAAGSGIDAVSRLRAGEARAAFLAVRPPGHHALAGRAMGFCLYNNVAVTAASLAAEGERVMILDWDAHHGNGTQAIFYDRADVVYISMHQFPFYPGTGRLDERGSNDGLGATINVPLPAGTTGDAYRAAFDEVVVPAAERFSPDWLIVSAGFDAHRADPLTDLGLSAGDYHDLTVRAMALVPPGRLIAFLEGGYDLEALAMSAGACVAALAGSSYRPEAGSTGAIPAAAREAISTAAQLGESSAPPSASTPGQ